MLQHRSYQTQRKKKGGSGEVISLSFSVMFSSEKSGGGVPAILM